MTNQYAYFDENKGMTLNKKCTVCKTDIWVREGVHTCYHGKKYLHNRGDKVMSILDINLGAMCPECFKNVNGEDDK